MNIIIVGCGKVGCTLVEALSSENHDIVVIDSRPEKVSALTDTVDVMGIVGNGVSHTTLKQAGIETADLLIAVTGSDEENLLCCVIAKKSGHCQTIARIRSRAQAAAPAASAAPVLPEGQGPEKSKYVREALAYLSEHYNDPDISVSSVARSLGVSDGHLSHVFKKETSYTLSAYLTNYRMHKATELLRDCRVKVYEVAESVGYRDITYFSSAFKKSVGMSPSEYQKRCQ